MFGKLYFLECIDNALLCTDYLPLRSCESRRLISFSPLRSTLSSLDLTTIDTVEEVGFLILILIIEYTGCDPYMLVPLYIGFCCF